MAYQNPTPRIALFSFTSDSFNQQVDRKLTGTLRDKVISSAPEGSFVKVMSLNPRSKNNEDLRVAIAEEGKKNGIAGIAGLRVVADRKLSIVYYGQYDLNTIYFGLNDLLPSLGTSQVSLDSGLMRKFTYIIKDTLFGKWAERHGIAYPEDDYKFNDWYFAHLKFNLDASKLLPSAKGAKGLNKFRHGISLMLNKLALDSILPQELVSAFKKERSCAKIKKFLAEAAIHDRTDAVRKILSAFNDSFYTYRESLGVRLKDIMRERIDFATKNQANNENTRNMITMEQENILAALGSETSTGHYPMFYVPMPMPHAAISSQFASITESLKFDWNKGFYSCVDIQLTPADAAKFIEQPGMAKNLASVIIGWASDDKKRPQ